MKTNKSKKSATRKTEAKAAPTTKLITSYGQYWTPLVVQWGHPGKLEGHEKNAKRQGRIDFWNSRGIYVLYKEYSVIYVGQSEGQALGKRIQDHLADNLAGRWDSFSWYSVSTTTKTGKIKDLAHATPGTVSFTTIINTLEAIGISLTPQTLNKQERRFPGAKEYIQTVPKETEKRIKRNIIDDRAQADEIRSEIADLKNEVEKISKLLEKSKSK